ncbi:hypothetical protein BS47DRAFT_940161 [Hydnum rufescens UP504]|uniref:BTB domain-containing protein n=1 Tax=Hydnum rufescens UP504 TaxID=1448309 RepID=A0A9P6DT18_9AGAM|nr:hypothetical protein BS47DRAFT_940161 [Hydnum rufescens UP504]
MHGGYDDDLVPTNATHFYSIRDNKWVYCISRANGDENVPISRTFHTATYVFADNEPYLFVLGGLHVTENGIYGDRNFVLHDLDVLNLRTRTWYPSLHVLSRYHHAAILLPGPCPHILIMGGRDARGVCTTFHYLIDVNAVLDTLRIHDERPDSMIDRLFGSSLSLPSNIDAPPMSMIPDSRKLWHKLDTFSEPIGPLNWHIWLALHHHTVFIFGQTPSGPPLTQDLLPGSPPSSVSGVVWALDFDMGWGSFEEVPVVSRHFRHRDTNQKWMWFDILDTGLRASSNDDTDDDMGDPSRPTEKVFFALSVAPQIVNAGEINGHLSDEDACRAMVIPMASLPLRYRKGPLLTINDNYGSSRYPSFASYLPPLWYPSQLEPIHNSESDIFIVSSTPDAPPLAVHSLIISARSSFFRTLLRSGLAETHSRQIRLDEPYIIVYSLLHYLYTDTLPAFLTRLPRSVSSHSDEWSKNAGNIAAALLVASNKYLAPPSLAVQLRVTLRRLLTPSDAYSIWRAAWLTRLGGAEGLPVDAASSAFQLCDEVGEVERGWMADAVRDAYRAQERETPSDMFFKEITRWCARRMDEITSVTDLGDDEMIGANTDAEACEAFWEDMSRLTGVVPLEGEEDDDVDS